MWRPLGFASGFLGQPWSGVTLFQPRDGERGGTFGQGKVVRTYAEGQVSVFQQITLTCGFYIYLLTFMSIFKVVTLEHSFPQWATVSAQITANHKGFFEFRLCPQNRTDVPASESCMNR